MQDYDHLHIYLHLLLIHYTGSHSIRPTDADNAAWQRVSTMNSQGHEVAALRHPYELHTWCANAPLSVCKYNCKDTNHDTATPRNCTYNKDGLHQHNCVQHKSNKLFPSHLIQPAWQYILHPMKYNTLGPWQSTSALPGRHGHCSMHFHCNCSRLMRFSCGRHCWPAAHSPSSLLAPVAALNPMRDA